MSYPLLPKKEEEFKSRQKGGRSEWIGKRQTQETQGGRNERNTRKKEGGNRTGKGQEEVEGLGTPSG